MARFSIRHKGMGLSNVVSRPGCGVSVAAVMGHQVLPKLASIVEPAIPSQVEDSGVITKVIPYPKSVEDKPGLQLFRVEMSGGRNLLTRQTYR